jgi:diadenosine tetraphosphatase ApaH/serine/threonine PP2A family protein phosphatase
VGHTHIPLAFRELDSGVEAIQPPDDEPLLFGDERLIVNPGSVGQPRDGDPRASALLLDTEARSLEWHRIEYPIKKVQKLMADRRLPVRLAARLSYGL